jgi:cystathionine beta-lyase/cystathionine gamma-synthase
MDNKSKKDKYHFATLAIHAGFSFDESTGAVMPPIYMTSTYAQKSPGEPISKYEYSRTANPTRDILQTNLAALENGRFGFSFASGCAALNTLLQMLPPQSHVIVSDDVYGGTLRLFAKVFAQWGLSFTQVDMTNLAEVKAAYRPQTKLVWLETPSNPLLKILDIAAICDINRQQTNKPWVAVDNTFATPYLQTPLDLGADIVCHSATKYIGGHSDVIGGALILNDSTLAEQMFFIENATGAVPSPMDCFLLLRSLKTLPIRMRAHCENAQKVAEFLAGHPSVKKVIYPGLSNHAQHELAQKQMRGFGGMISFELKGEMNDAKQFLKKLQLFTLAESLGGVESLVESPAIMTHAAIPAEHRKKIGIADTLIRLSVGIEDVRDLIDDLKGALG